ncbi:MAG: PEP-CTERM sorting domain-containing protein [Planctomycetia bacterium]|nr:PEP-CTERM sorting domain-containing protein [Planctomycetia bacterium]
MPLTKLILFSGSAAVLALLLAGPESHAAFFTYQFSGQVTEVDNPNGFFTDVAAVGAPVSGAFTYTDSPNGSPFSLNPNFTNYTHQESPPDTGIVLIFNDIEAHASEFSLTNMIVGNDNLDDFFPPFFPPGDSFRYGDSLDGTSALFDFSQAEFFQFANAGLFLADSSSEAFDSQDLPSGLPLSAFDGRYGLVDIYDDNFEATGKLVFQIDSIRAVPEPSTYVLATIGLFGMASVIRQRKRR